MAKKILLKGTHGITGKAFEELSFPKQSQSINGQINRLSASIRAHLRNAAENNQDPDEILLRRIAQIARSINNLINHH